MEPAYQEVVFGAAGVPAPGSPVIPNLVNELAFINSYLSSFYFKDTRTTGAFCACPDAEGKDITTMTHVRCTGPLRALISGCPAARRGKADDITCAYFRDEVVDTTRHLHDSFRKLRTRSFAVERTQPKQMPFGSRCYTALQDFIRCYQNAQGKPVGQPLGPPVDVDLTEKHQNRRDREVAYPYAYATATATAGEVPVPRYLPHGGGSAGAGGGGGSMGMGRDEATLIATWRVTVAHAAEPEPYVDASEAEAHAARRAAVERVARVAHLTAMRWEAEAEAEAEARAKAKIRKGKLRANKPLEQHVDLFAVARGDDDDDGDGEAGRYDKRLRRGDSGDSGDSTH
jgi:hypothetical protein